MYGQYLDCTNTLSPRIGAKLYLNLSYSDVNFVFGTGTGEIEKVPAHKLILATSSPVFHDILYGRSSTDDFLISNATIEEFREFLQFFYLNKVRLTPKNIVKVIDLCRKFKVPECITVCIVSLQNSMTIDDICWGYGIALSVKHQNLVEFCEEKLKDTTAEIFESESFLECDHKLLDKIITLVSSECAAIEIVDACMKWAKAECRRINVLRTPKNMRQSLRNIFEKMPFEKLTLEQLSKFICSYKNILTGKELKTITNKIIMTTKHLTGQTIEGDQLQSEWMPNEYVLDCDRRLSGELVPMHSSGGDIFTAFSSNKQMVLKEFYAKMHGTAKFNGKVPYDINVNHMEKIVSAEGNIYEGSDQIHIILPEPVTIEAKKMYSINIYTWNIDCIEYSEDELYQPLLKHRIQTKDIEIMFKTNFQFDSDTISRFVFLKSNIAAFDERDWIIIDHRLKETNDSSDEETVSR